MSSPSDAPGNQLELDPRVPLARRHGAPRPAEGMRLLTALPVDVSSSPGFRRANLAPVTPPLAVIILGGLCELTALTVEDGHDPRDIVEPAVAASTAILGQGDPAR